MTLVLVAARLGVGRSARPWQPEKELHSCGKLCTKLTRLARPLALPAAKLPGVCARSPLQAGPAHEFCWPVVFGHLQVTTRSYITVACPHHSSG